MTKKASNQLGKRILLVDDLEEVITLYKKTLDKAGFQVKTASSGEDAIEKIPLFNPDLIILDIMMPKMDGWDVAKHIRNELKLGTPIIMLTVKGFIEDQIKSVRQAGANKHLTKPVSGPELINTIESLLIDN